MSILETLFGPKPQQQPQQQPVPNQQSQTGSPVVPGQPNPTDNPGGTTADNSDPMAQFADLWKAPENNSQANLPKFEGMAPEAIAQSAQSVDFSKVVTPEMLSQITQGGEGATKAFMQAMNSMAQASHAYSIQSSQGLIEKAMEAAEKRFTAQLPDMIRRNSVMDGIKENPVLSNPAVAPVVSAVAQQIALKHPQASAAQVKQMAEDYVMGMSKAFQPQQQSQPTQGQGQNTDWSTYL